MAEVAEQRSFKTNGYPLRCHGQEAAFAEILSQGEAACFACSRESLVAGLRKSPTPGVSSPSRYEMERNGGVRALQHDSKNQTVYGYVLSLRGQHEAWSAGENG